MNFQNVDFKVRKGRYYVVEKKARNYLALKIAAAAIGALGIWHALDRVVFSDAEQAKQEAIENLNVQTKIEKVEPQVVVREPSYLKHQKAPKVTLLLENHLDKKSREIVASELKNFRDELGCKTFAVEMPSDLNEVYQKNKGDYKKFFVAAKEQIHENSGGLTRVMTDFMFERCFLHEATESIYYLCQAAEKAGMKVKFIDLPTEKRLAIGDGNKIHLEKTRNAWMAEQMSNIDGKVLGIFGKMHGGKGKHPWKTSIDIELEKRKTSSYSISLRSDAELKKRGFPKADCGCEENRGITKNELQKCIRQVRG